MKGTIIRVSGDHAMAHARTLTVEWETIDHGSGTVTRQYGTVDLAEAGDLVNAQSGDKVELRLIPQEETGGE